MRKTAGLLACLPIVFVACASTSSDPNDVGGSQYEALESEPTTSAADSAAARASHALKTAFVIVLENQNWASITGNPSAPFINRSVLPNAAIAENYFDNPKAVHPSEPNYIWMEAGDNLGIEDDNDPKDNYKNTKKHLVSLLETANVPWKSYEQGIDGKSCPVVGQNQYATKHDPVVFFSDITEHNDPTSADCIAHVRPEAELATDLANDAVSGYVFITPDLCHDMHDACASGNQVKNGDDFLAVEIPKIQASNAYKNGGAIFITWDESEDGEHPIGMVVLSPLAKVGYRSTTRFFHSSLLRTMQEMFAVQPYLRDAANATSLGELFNVYP